MSVITLTWSHHYSDSHPVSSETISLNMYGLLPFSFHLLSPHSSVMEGWKTKVASSEFCWDSHVWRPSINKPRPVHWPNPVSNMGDIKALCSTKQVLSIQCVTAMLLVFAFWIMEIVRVRFEKYPFSFPLLRSPLPLCKSSCLSG